MNRILLLIVDRPGAGDDLPDILYALRAERLQEMMDEVQDTIKDDGKDLQLSALISIAAQILVQAANDEDSAIDPPSVIEAFKRTVISGIVQRRFELLHAMFESEQQPKQ